MNKKLHKVRGYTQFNLVPDHITHTSEMVTALTMLLQLTCTETPIPQIRGGKKRKEYVRIYIPSRASIKHFQTHAHVIYKKRREKKGGKGKQLAFHLKKKRIRFYSQATKNTIDKQARICNKTLLALNTG